MTIERIVGHPVIDNDEVAVSLEVVRVDDFARMDSSDNHIVFSG